MEDWMKDEAAAKSAQYQASTRWFARDGLIEIRTEIGKYAIIESPQGGMTHEILDADDEGQSIGKIRIYVDEIPESVASVRIEGYEAGIRVGIEQGMVKARSDIRDALGL